MKRNELEKNTSHSDGAKSTYVMSLASELMSVIHVGIVVFCDHHTVGKLASCQCLHGLLTFCSRHVLHENLQQSVTTDKNGYMVCLKTN